MGEVGEGGVRGDGGGGLAVGACVCVRWLPRLGSWEINILILACCNLLIHSCCISDDEEEQT